MISKVLVYSRQMIEYYADGAMSPAFDRWYLISIHNEYPLSAAQGSCLKSKGCRAICSVSFGDSSDLTGPKAGKIVDFIAKAHQDPEDSVLVVHCMAGVSRSGAVGQFACEYSGASYADLKKACPEIDPDEGIVSKLRDVT